VREGAAVRGEFLNEYRKLNLEDKKTFRRWLLINATIATTLLAGLIALSSFPRNQSGEANAQNPAMHTQAKLNSCRGHHEMSCPDVPARE
jgi:hypothetical protein